MQNTGREMEEGEMSVWNSTEKLVEHKGEF